MGAGERAALIVGRCWAEVLRAMSLGAAGPGPLTALALIFTVGFLGGLVGCLAFAFSVDVLRGGGPRVQARLKQRRSVLVGEGTVRAVHARGTLRSLGTMIHEGTLLRSGSSFLASLL